jgi:rubredoxin-NAD+ reductase
MKPIVVLGSGLAGYTLVRELRKLDRDAAITLITRDSGDYYSKPMLSNALAQRKSAQALLITAAADMAEQLGFGLLQYTEVLGIDRAQKQLRTSSGTIEYDRLVLALGADPIRLPLQGDAADAVMSVNDLADYANFRDALETVPREAGHVAIIGAGLIGCEFANDLAAAGYAVTIIDPTAYPLSGLLPEQAGRQLIDPLAAQGVAFRFGAAVNAVNLQPKGYVLALSDGTILHADLVLSAVGLRPRIGLARDTGLAVNRGITVDARMCSSDASIYALGDCAEIEGRVQPYVLPIMHAARTLAQILAGTDARVEFPAMPVVVKTPAHPVAVLPVARDATGAWRSLADDDRRGAKLGFFDLQDRLQGFALTGEYAAERSAMAKQLGARVSLS